MDKVDKQTHTQSGAIDCEKKKTAAMSETFLRKKETQGSGCALERDGTAGSEPAMLRA